MGMDLFPNKTGAESFSCNIHMWEKLMLDTPLGYVIGYARGVEINTVMLDPLSENRPDLNDGFKVDAEQCRIMHYLALQFLDIEAARIDQWEDMTELERTNSKGNPSQCTTPIFSEAGLRKFKEFVDFLENAEGFEIW